MLWHWDAPNSSASQLDMTAPKSAPRKKAVFTTWSFHASPQIRSQSETTEDLLQVQLLIIQFRH